MNDIKAMLRLGLRQMRKQLSIDQVNSFSLAIFRHVVAAPFYQQAHTIGCYYPIDNEVDPSLLLLDAADSGKKIFLPIVEKKSGILRFVAYRPGDPLRLGVFGILEPILPARSSVDWNSGSPDVIFQPLVGFDGFGGRLGYGGGYYDRTLSHDCASLLVGLAYGFQEVPVVPHEFHDVRMGHVVTELGVRSFTNAL